jgi:hypothetical protein
MGAASARAEAAGVGVQNIENITVGGTTTILTAAKQQGEAERTQASTSIGGAPAGSINLNVNTGGKKNAQGSTGTQQQTQQGGGAVKRAAENAGLDASSLANLTAEERRILEMNKYYKRLDSGNIYQ